MINHSSSVRLLEYISVSSLFYFLQYKKRYQISSIEFQTEPDENMGFRMLDYRVRVYRRFPRKTMHQVVIYLKPTKSALVYQDSFQLGATIHRYRVIRLWEELPEAFLNNLGLLPLAVLSKSSDPTVILRKVAEVLETIPDNNLKQNLTAATAVFSGLVIQPDIVKTILKSQFMKESAIYQEILQEGLQKGRQEGLQEGLQRGKLEVAQQLLQLGMSLFQVAQVTGLSEQELQQSLSL
jgi:predicted transposase/invertase (TIGR01784 family)